MRAILTWNRLGVIVTEEVEMIPEDKPLYTPVPGIGVVELPYTTSALFDTGKVFFEDENGIFGLTPQQIISIEVIGRNIYDGYNENHNCLIKENIMNRIKTVARSTKNFVVNHKVALAVTVTVITMAKLNKIALDEYNNFLVEKDLLDEFNAHGQEEL